jgi:hypothetical protein
MMKIAKMIEESGFYRIAYLVGPKNSAYLTHDADRAFWRSGKVTPQEAFPVRQQRMRQDIDDRMQPGEDKKMGRTPRRTIARNSQRRL